MTKTITGALDKTDWTAEQKLQVLTGFLDSMAEPFVRDEAIRYVELQGKLPEGPAPDMMFWAHGEQLRLTAISMLKQLAPVIAARGIRLKGVGPGELSDLLILLRHIDGRISSAERRSRRGW